MKRREYDVTWSNERSTAKQSDVTRGNVNLEAEWRQAKLRSEDHKAEWRNVNPREDIKEELSFMSNEISIFMI